MISMGPTLTDSPPQLHVTANLPPIISFSSAEEPQLELHMTLQHSQPIILTLKRSRLWPLHLHSSLTVHHASSDRQEYLPRIDAARRDPPMPPLDAEHKNEFVGLRPGETAIIRVSFRPYSEPYDYAIMEDQGAERYKMLFPIGMQFLKPEEVYEIGIEEGCAEAYIVGDLEQMMGEGDNIAAWTPADNVVEVVVGEKSRFRVVA